MSNSRVHPIVDRQGHGVSSFSEVVKRTAEVSGLPYDSVKYVLSAFIGVLGDKIVTDGGATLPNIGTFYTAPDNSEVAPKSSRYETKPLFNKKVMFTINDKLSNLHKAHTALCAPGERIVTPETWEIFCRIYGRSLEKNPFGAGLYEAHRVRKDSAPMQSLDNEDYVPAIVPIRNNFMDSLVKKMNETGDFNPEHHTGESAGIIPLEDSDFRLIRLSDLTETTQKYITEENISRVARLKELKESGKLDNVRWEPKSSTKGSVGGERR